MASRRVRNELDAFVLLLSANCLITKCCWSAEQRLMGLNMPDVRPTHVSRAPSDGLK